MKREFEKGRRVIVRGYRFVMHGVTVDKTRGDCTTVKLDDGRTMLISNKALEYEK